MKITVNSLLVLLVSAPTVGAQPSSVFDHFVTTTGSRLMDGDRELRFILFNIPSLHSVQDTLQSAAEAQVSRIEIYHGGTGGC